jgi:hypothetical protein
MHFRNEKGPEYPGLFLWAMQGSNLRLPPCEGGTLPLTHNHPRGEGLREGPCHDPAIHASAEGLCIWRSRF